MSLYDILVAIVVGAISGWLARAIMNSKGGLIKNIVLGIVGGFVGRFLFGLLKINFTLSLGPINVATIIVSAIGACIVIFIVNKFLK